MQVSRSQSLDPAAPGLTLADFWSSVCEQIVCFVQPAGGGPIRIASTSDARGLLAEMQPGCPEELRVIFAMYGGSGMERLIRGQLADASLGRGWYEAGPAESLIAEIRPVIRRAVELYWRTGQVPETPVITRAVPEARPVEHRAAAPPELVELVRSALTAELRDC